MSYIILLFSMTVYIKIKDAVLPAHHEHIQTTLLKIQAQDSELFAHGKIVENRIEWNVNLISSISENKLQFQLLDEQMGSHEVFKADLYFSTFRCLPDKQISESIIFKNGLRINLEIFYMINPRYLGQLEFYDIQRAQNRYKIAEESEIQEKMQKFAQQKTQENTPRQVVNDKPKVNFFFCCGDQEKDDKFQVQQDYGPRRNKYPEESPFQNELKAKQRQKIFKQPPNFYKGACQNKNLFSICDTGTKDEQFQIIQDHYRQK